MDVYNKLGKISYSEKYFLSKPSSEKQIEFIINTSIIGRDYARKIANDLSQLDEFSYKFNDQGSSIIFNIELVSQEIED